MSEEQLFYLRARGIGRDEARAMLIGAFTGEVVERMPDERVRAHVGGLLARRLAAMTGSGAR